MPKKTPLKCGCVLALPGRPQRFVLTGRGSVQAEVFAPCAHYGRVIRVRGDHWAPTIRCLERQMDNGVVETPDGCWVEPDGHCQHGFPSWLLLAGLI